MSDAANQVIMPKARPPAARPPAAASKAAAAAPAKAAPPPPTWKKKLVWIVPVVMMGAGYGLGAAFLKGSEKADHGDHLDHPAPVPATLDDLIVAGEFDDALKQIKGALKNAPADTRTALKFREALCREGVGKFAEAGEVYATLGSASDGSPRGILCRLGLARCQARSGRMDDARLTAARVLLSSADPIFQKYPLLAEAYHTMAVIEMVTAPMPPKPHPFRLDGFARPERPFELATYLGWVGPVPVHRPKGHGAHDAHGADDHGDHGHSPKPGAKPKADEHAPKAPPKKKHDDHAHPPAPAKPKGDHPTPAPAPPEKHDAPKPKADPHDHPEHSITLPISAPADHPPPPPAEPKKATGLRVQRAVFVGTETLSGQAPPTPVLDVLESTVRQAGWKVMVFPDARERLQGRSALVNVQRLGFADFLDALTAPYGLAWTADGPMIKVTTEAVAPGSVMQRTARILEQAGKFANHPWQSAARIDRGNLEAFAGRWRTAADWYSRVLADASLRPESTPASYNLGVIGVRNGDRALAREQFLMVADRDPEGPFATLAYWWTGRTYLDGDEPEKAAAWFEKAIAQSPDSPSGLASILGLAAAHLRAGDNDAGLAVLKAYKARLKASAVRPMAAFLDSFGRYRLAAKPTRTGEADDLLHATLAIANLTPLGPTGVYLHGLAFRELGMGKNLAEQFDSVRQDTRGPMATRLLLEVGEYYESIGRADLARDRLLAVAAVDRGECGRRARARLASLANSAGAYGEAVRHCREILADGGDVESTLKILARAYGGLKDYRRAAKCFAGEVPSP